MSEKSCGSSGRNTTKGWKRATSRARRKAKKKGQNTGRLFVKLGDKQRLVTV